MRVTSEVKAEIAHLIPLAPSHSPAALRDIENDEKLLGALPQIAVFDTAFGADLPDAAALYPIPGNVHNAVCDAPAFTASIARHKFRRGSF